MSRPCLVVRSGDVKRRRLAGGGSHRLLAHHGFARYTEHLNRFGYIKGRGSLSNPAGRFEQLQCEREADGWDEADDEERPSTQSWPEPIRSIVTHNDSPDVPFERSINPYKGCEHGCIYCFARPSHAYLGLSAGLDFETKIAFKPDAAERLRETFQRPSYRAQAIALGANTDPYQPLERRKRITREILEVLAEFRHPVGIITKSDLVLRDCDLLAQMAEKRLVNVYFSITTFDAQLARCMEPRAAVPERRLGALRRLSQAGVPVGVLVSPIIPGLNDGEIEDIVERAAEVGAERAGGILLRLPHGLKDLFEHWLQEHYPLKAKRVMALVRQTRGGKLYRSDFGERMRGTGPYAKMLRSRLNAACRRFGLDRTAYPFDCGQFTGGARQRRQLRLF